ncbi:MAG TPA: VWA domain-containing protein [Candidatus Polarisedimenticolia bacterium]|nr:VWA domain-containing protein [Candidatus Polarisedimenticolia bacterium]
MPFGEPRALLLLLLVPILALFFALMKARRRRLLARFGGEEMMKRLTTAPGTGRWVLRVFLVLVGLTFLVLALARPRWGRRMEEVKRRGVDVLVAVDVSASMLSEDVRPSRLARARGEVASLLDSLGGDRIGLVAFAGEAYVACPLTLDYSAAKVFLDVLDPSLIPVPGTAIAEAIRKSTRAFNARERRYKVLILITDGEDHVGDPLVAAREAAAEGVVIYTVGVGTGAGSPIPERDPQGAVTGYKQDREGHIVTSRLDPVKLAEIAEVTGGKYLPATAEGRELREIEARIARMERREVGSRITITYEERYQIPLAVALAALLLEAALGDRLFPRRERVES